MEQELNELLERVKQLTLTRLVQEGLGNADGECSDVSIYSALFSELASDACENLAKEDVEELSDLLLDLSEELVETVQDDDSED